LGLREHFDYDEDEGWHAWVRFGPTDGHPGIDLHWSRGHASLDADVMLGADRAMLTLGVGLRDPRRCPPPRAELCVSWFGRGPLLVHWSRTGRSHGVVLKLPRGRRLRLVGPARIATRATDATS
jgi:hypothetical protein